MLFNLVAGDQVNATYLIVLKHWFDFARELFYLSGHNVEYITGDLSCAHFQLEWEFIGKYISTKNFLN